jgi:hypothetical protein
MEFGRSDNLPEPIHDVFRLGNIEDVRQGIKILALVGGDSRLCIRHCCPFGTSHPILLRNRGTERD